MIYLDNNSTTPLDPAVLEAMLPYFTKHFGNPSNHIHAIGSAAERGVENARAQVAAAINADPDAIVFTSGATESNNLAILGTARALRNSPGHLVISAIEHKSVIGPCRHLERSGWKVTCVASSNLGRLDSDAIGAAISEDTVLVSVMAANNEVGTIQPISEIGEICRKSGVLFHCDAAQALGRLPIDVEAWGVDLLSLSAHKAYGPKGVGALFVKEKQKAMVLQPLCFGGGQEESIRPGTLPVPNIVGLGAACELAVRNLPNEPRRLRRLRQKLLFELSTRFPNLITHGHPTDNLPGLLAVGFPGIDGDAFLFALQDVAISQGSACSAGSPDPSHVLTALGVNYELARSSFRFGIGRFTTEEEIQWAATAVANAMSAIS